MKKIKLYEDFSVSNPEKRLISFSEFIYESRQTEDRARAILKELPNQENLIAQFRQGDKSNNKINIPLMAYLYTIQVDKNTEQIIELVEQYRELLTKNQIGVAEIKEDGIKIGGKLFSDYLEFAEHIHSFQEARSGDWKISQEEMNNFKAEAKPMWSGNNIDIYNGNNVGKCIAYTHGGLTPISYTFCIGKHGSANLYKSYRDKSVSTFYFIVDKNKFKLDGEGNFDDSDPLHMVVFDMTELGPVLTDANNRTGNIAEYGSDTKKYIEYLKSKGVPVEKLFVNRPKTEQEKYENELLGEQNPDLEWFKNLDNPKNPNWREPKREEGDPKESYYKFCYIGRGHLLSDEQFDYLMEYKFEMLLKKYVDTGVLLPVYQVDNLTKELKDTYLRKRLIAAEQTSYRLEDYEFRLLTPEQQIQYVTKRAENGKYISDDEFELLTRDQQIQYVTKRAENGHDLTYDKFKLLTQEQMGQLAMKWAAQKGHHCSYGKYELLLPEQRFQYVMKTVEKGKDISYEQFKLLTQDQMGQYAIKMIQNGHDIFEHFFELLLPEQQQKYKEEKKSFILRLKIFHNAMKKARNGHDISYKEFELFTPDQMGQYAMELAENGGKISNYEFRLLTQDQRFQYAMKRAEKGRHISYEQFELLTPEQQQKYKEKKQSFLSRAKKLIRKFGEFIRPK